jgi:hypothetical protein
MKHSQQIQSVRLAGPWVWLAVGGQSQVIIAEFLWF